MHILFFYASFYQNHINRFLYNYLSIEIENYKMNFTIDTSNITVENALKNVRFLEKKQNIIMPGEFTKIMYSVDIMTMNGIYFLCPLKCIDKPVLKQSVLGSTISSSSYNKHMIWFQQNSVENYDILNYFRSFENQLVQLYLKHCELYNNSCYGEKTQHKTCVYSLSNQLSSGCTRVCRDFIGEDIDSIFLPKNKKDKHNKTVRSLTADTMSSKLNLNHLKCDNPKADKVVYAIKISGVWETVNEIGITYKFIEMNDTV